MTVICLYHSVKLSQLLCNHRRLIHRFSNDNFFLGVVSRPSRPSPNALPLEIITTNEPQATLSDEHYDRLEAILIEKIQTYVQGGMINLFPFLFISNIYMHGFF